MWIDTLRKAVTGLKRNLDTLRNAAVWLKRNTVSLATSSTVAFSLLIFPHPAPLAPYPPCLDLVNAYGDIRKFFDMEGGLEAYGCPTSLESDYGDGRTQEFRHGQIWWRDFGGGHVLTWGAYQARLTDGTWTSIKVNWLDNADRDFYRVYYHAYSQDIGQIESDGDDGPLWLGVQGPNLPYKIQLRGCEKTGFLGLGTPQCFDWLPEITVWTDPETQWVSSGTPDQSDTVTAIPSQPANIEPSIYPGVVDYSDKGYDVTITLYNSGDLPTPESGFDVALYLLDAQGYLTPDGTAATYYYFFDSFYVPQSIPAHGSFTYHEHISTGTGDYIFAIAVDRENKAGLMKALTPTFTVRSTQPEAINTTIARP